MNWKGKRDKDDDWSRVFDDMDGMFDAFPNFKKVQEHIDELMKKSMDGNLSDMDKNPFVFGFSVKTGPDGMPKFQQFGNTGKNIPGKVDSSTPKFKHREPITDVNYSDDFVSITLEIPGVSKKDIDVDATENKIVIKVNTEARQYFKEVDLKYSIISDSAKATYTNGILDLVFKKKDKTPKGTKIEVK